MGLRQSSPEEPGWTRRRAGKGFAWYDAEGRLLDPEQRARCVALVIPPAWEEVWVCVDPDGHLQAVGTDAAGRRQYLYHLEWRRKRDEEKYDRALAFGERLGRTRGLVRRHLADEDITARRACGVAFRLLDRGSFRIGSDVYADENGSFGLTTLRPEHVRLRGGVLSFDFVGKSEVVHHVEVDDPDVIDAICRMRRRRSAKGTLLAFRDGSTWRQLAPEAVNDYIRQVTRLEVTAKDFRTWHGGLGAAATLATLGPKESEKEQDAAIREAVQAAADVLGNTPALARSAYVDPRILERYREGRTVKAATARGALAEQAGFEALWISDHFHPWNDEQGESAFVWSVIGALSQACSLPVTTAVTCPTVRMHPAIVAQAAATSAVMHEGRFILGLGSGEALNEHILGDPWPSADVRLEMLEEAVELIRELWKGEFTTHRGRHYTTDTARIYTLPEQPPEIWISGFGPKATDLAARIGDGYVTTTPDTELLQRFREQSGGKPAMIGIKVSWAPTVDEGVEHAHRLWGTSGLPGELAQVLPSPRHFEQGAELVTKEQTASSVTCGPDVGAHVAALRECVDAGFEQVYVANIGPHYREMIDVFGKEVLPRLR